MENNRQGKLDANVKEHVFHTEKVFFVGKFMMHK